MKQFSLKLIKLGISTFATLVKKNFKLIFENVPIIQFGSLNIHSTGNFTPSPMLILFLLYMASLRQEKKNGYGEQKNFSFFNAHFKYHYLNALPSSVLRRLPEKSKIGNALWRHLERPNFFCRTWSPFKTVYTPEISWCLDVALVF